jgi:hypothetical protein
VPEPREGTLEQRAAEAKIDNLFLDLLRRLTKQSRNVTDKKGTSYAPSVFADEPEAKAVKATNKILGEAMRRLFANGKIKLINEGPASRQRTRMVEANFVEEIRTKTIGEAPGATCVQCHSNDGRVLKIKNAGKVGGKTETLHEACAQEWFRRGAPPTFHQQGKAFHQICPHSPL